MSYTSILSAMAESLHLSPAQAQVFAQAAQRAIPEFLNPDSPRYRNFTFSAPNQILALEEVAAAISDVKTSRPNAQLSASGIERLFVDKFTHYLAVDSTIARETLDKRHILPSWMADACAAKENFPKLLHEDSASIVERIEYANLKNDFLKGRTIIEVTPDKNGVLVSKDDPGLASETKQAAGFVSRLRDGSQKLVEGYQDFVRDHRVSGFAVAGGEVAIGSALLLRGGRQLCNQFGTDKNLLDEHRQPTAAGKLWAAVQALSGVALTSLGVYTGFLAYQGRGRG